MRGSYLLEAFTESPWAILPEKLLMLESLLLSYIAGEDLTLERDALEAAERPQSAIFSAQGNARGISNVAILPIFGTIVPRGNLMSAASGMTSAETLGKQFQDLIEDPQIDAIVLDINSPGGQVGGVDELSAQIYNARGIKPIKAIANHLAASAAYWIGTAADELAITPSGMVGSIGVFAEHRDLSGALDQAGIKVSLISAGKYKTEGNPFGPLSEEAAAAMQTRVNEVYDAFVEALARNRGVALETVRDDFGGGRIVGSAQALALGMADRIATLGETINTLFGISDSEGSRLSVNSLDDYRAAASGQAARAEPAPDPDLLARAEALRAEIAPYLARKESKDAI